MKATKQGAAYKSPSMRRMAEGGSAKPKRKVMKRAKDGTLTELTGANADKVRAAVKSGKTKDIQGGSKLAQLLGINKKYNVVGGDKPAKKPAAVSTSGGAPKTSKKPKARTVTKRGMSNTDQMRARTRGKTDTTTKTDANDPRNMNKSTPGAKKKTTAPAKNPPKLSTSQKAANAREGYRRAEDMPEARRAAKSNKTQLKTRAGKKSAPKAAAYSTRELSKRVEDVVSKGSRGSRKKSQGK